MGQMLTGGEAGVAGMSAAAGPAGENYGAGMSEAVPTQTGGAGLMSTLQKFLGENDDERSKNLNALGGALQGFGKITGSMKDSTFLERARQVQVSGAQERAKKDYFAGDI